MNRKAVIALIYAAATLGASAEPGIAVVRVREIYAALPATEDLQKQVKQERDAILRDPRAEALRRIIAVLQSIQARLSDKKNPLDDESAVKMARQYELTRQEAQTLQRDYESFRTKREKEINRRMIAGMRASLSLIHETARKVGAEKGYDLVLDNSGNTNTGVPFVLYQKNAPDLTDAVVAALEQHPTNASASTDELPNP
jgi:Skp family chaperone for outer membrane proteins